MKVHELIERLKSMPPDAIVTAFDADSDCVVAVTGLLSGPDGHYSEFREEDESVVLVKAFTVQIQTDD